MRNNWYKKGLVVGIIILLIGAIVVPRISGDVKKKSEDFHILNNETRPSSITDWWPMFRHDPQHSGYSTSTTADVFLVKWTFETSEEIYTSPSVVSGKVYIGSRDGRLRCLNADNGSEIWKYNTGGGFSYSSPAVAYGNVYVSSLGKYVRCLDANNGSVKWDYYLEASCSSAPTVVNEKVYIGGNWNKVICLNAFNGSQIWKYSTGSTVMSSPAVVDGKVYVGSLDSKIHCFNADNGSSIWTFETGDNIFSSPTVVDGKVYIGSYDRNVYCLNAENGSLIWSYETVDEIHSSPAVAYGKVYIGSDDDNIYCLNAENGSKIWSYETGAGVVSSPAVADGKVFIGSYDDNIHCLNAENGIKIWGYETGGAVRSCPAVADEKIYVGSFDHRVYCFDESENQHPEIPTIDGSTSGTAGEEYEYTFVTTDPDGGDVCFYVDWGDNTSTGWTDFVPSGYEIILTHTWEEQGTYTIRAKAKDVYDAESDWAYLEVEILENEPPNKPTITGPNSGKPGIEYTYCIDASDPDNDTLYVLWNWDDGTSSGWLGPYVSGTEVCDSHTWNETGTYTISVTVRDEHGASVTAYKEVTMPRNKALVNSLFLRFLERFPLLNLLLQRILA